MSTHAAASQMIMQNWVFAWNAGSLFAMPVEHENMKFKPPTDAPWGRLTLTRGDSSQMALGGPAVQVERTPFILNLQIFIPENQGTRARDQAADAMKKLNKTSDSSFASSSLVVNFHTTSISTIQAEKGAGFLIATAGYYDLQIDTP